MTPSLHPLQHGPRPCTGALRTPALRSQNEVGVGPHNVGDGSVPMSITGRPVRCRSLSCDIRVSIVKTRYPHAMIIKVVSTQRRQQFNSKRRQSNSKWQSSSSNVSQPGVSRRTDPEHAQLRDEQHRSGKQARSACEARTSRTMQRHQLK